MKIITPQRICNDGSLVYLGGPTAGAAEWQFYGSLMLQKAYDSLRSNGAPDLLIASPVFQGGMDNSLVGDDARELTEAEWNQFYQCRARNKGTTMFWLGSRTTLDDSYHIPAKRHLDHLLSEYSADPSISLVVGTNKDFPEWEQIQARLERLGLPMYFILEETCAAAAKMAYVRAKN